MDQDIEALRNYGIALQQIAESVALPRKSSPADIVGRVRAIHATITATPTSKDNVCYHFHQIGIALGLDPVPLPDQVLAKVRETKAAADLAGAALEIERDSSLSISPETFAAWDRHDQDINSELTLFSDGSGELFTDMGELLLDFKSPSELAAFFDAH